MSSSIDVQDVGSRYYTFVWTMVLAMRACAKAGKAFVVLDRPNPIGGVARRGRRDRRRASSRSSGWCRVPNRHGMTAGEIARWWRRQPSRELDFASSLDCDLTMRGWAARHVLRAHGPAVGACRRRTCRRVDTALVYPGHVPRRGHRAVGGARHDAAVRARRRAVPRRPRAGRRPRRDGAAGRAVPAGRRSRRRSRSTRASRAAACSSTSPTATRSGRTAPASRSSRRATTRAPTEFAWRDEGVRVRRHDPGDRSARRHRRDPRGHRGRRAPRRACRALAARRGRRSPRSAARSCSSTSEDCGSRRAVRRQLQPAARRAPAGRALRARDPAVDELWFVPTYEHAFGKPLAPYDDRVAMCELAAAALGPRVTGQHVERTLGRQASRTLRRSAACASFIRRTRIRWSSALTCSRRWRPGSAAPSCRRRCRSSWWGGRDRGPGGRRRWPRQDAGGQLHGRSRCDCGRGAGRGARAAGRSRLHISPGTV